MTSVGELMGSSSWNYTENWNSGLKTLPNSRTTTHVSRWGDENGKVIPDAKIKTVATMRRSKSCDPSVTGHGVSSLGGDSWVAGSKVLPDRKAVSPLDRKQVKTKETEVIDWQGTRKSLPRYPKADLHYDNTWFNENLKVLPYQDAHLKSTWEKLEERKAAANTHSKPEGWYWTGADDKKVNRKKAPSPESARAAPVHTGRGTHLAAPGSWTSENMKILDNARKTNPSKYARDEPWAGAYGKTVGNTARHYVLHDWEEDNFKTLDLADRKSKKYNNRYVIENTGWDSGLYKSLTHEDWAKARAKRGGYYSNNDAWAVAGKTLPRDEQYVAGTASGATKKRYEIYGTGWDSGLKTLEHSKKPVHNNGHWDVENFKTLQWHAQEGRRRIDMPRHMDMLQYHERICGHKEPTYYF